MGSWRLAHITVVVAVVGALALLLWLRPIREGVYPVSVGRLTANYLDFDNDRVSDDNTIRITVFGGEVALPDPERNLFARISGDNFKPATVYFKGSMPPNVKELVAETDAEGNWNVDNRWMLEISANPDTGFNENTKISFTIGYKHHWEKVYSPLTLTRMASVALG
jgi:hypothetical protein